MCHPEVPPGAPIPDVQVKDAAIPVEDGAMPALLALPEKTPAPGILILNDVFGHSPFYDQLARRLAQAVRRGDAGVFLSRRLSSGTDPRGRDRARQAARLQALES